MARMNVETAIDKTKAVVARATAGEGSEHGRGHRAVHVADDAAAAVSLRRRAPSRNFPPRSFTFVRVRRGPQRLRGHRANLQEHARQEGSALITARESFEGGGGEDVEAARIEGFGAADAIPEPEPEFIPPPRVTPEGPRALAKSLRP